MKKLLITIIGLIGLAAPVAEAQTLLNSWENSQEGWTILEPAWTSAGFSTNTGVTAGSYSWELTATGADYGNVLQGPSSTALTTLLSDAGQVTLDVLVPTNGSFGYYQQWDLVVNQPGGLGSIDYDGGCYCQSPSIGGPESTLVFTIPAAIRTALAANPTLPTSLTFKIGGGGGGTIFIDNLRVWEIPTFTESWENTEDGWTILETAWTSSGFSTNTGVTAGTYSWELTATGADYGGVLQSPSSTALTTALSIPGTMRLDVLVPTNGSFGYYQQWDLVVNQPGGLGSMDYDGGCYCQSPSIGGPESELVFALPSSITTALAANPTLPTSLTFKIGGGGGGSIFIDNLRYIPNAPPIPAAAQLFVRELWDDLTNNNITPATAPVTDDTSSAGFAVGIPWVCNPAETPTNTQLMAFRTGFPNETSLDMGLPGSLDGSEGCMVQQNNGFGFFPAPGGPTFWTEGDFMTRELTPNNFINFQAVGEYWFTMTIANGTQSLDYQYVVDPSSGAGGIGFADGSTTNADFLAVGVTGLNVFFGPTNASFPFGETNASKAVYISQGTLGQPGNLNSTVYNPTNDPTYNGLYTGGTFTDAPFTQTNFTSGPYHINAFGEQTVGNVAADGIVVLGHLKTLGGGAATLDAKYYTLTGGNPWNTDLDTNTSNITYDCSYSFNFGGTMTKMLLFQNGQFPFYIFGFRASTNFADVVGLDRGRIEAAPLANTFVGYPLNLTNLAVEAASTSFASPPANYGTLTYQWFQNGVLIPGATSQFINIASASTNDPNMPAHTDAGTYTSVATDPSGTWGSVTSSIVVTVTQLNPPVLTGVQMFGDQATFQLTFDEPNLIGVTNAEDYVFNEGIVTTNVTVTNTATTTLVQIRTTTLPIGTRIQLTVSGVTNVVGGTLTTNLSFWTDLSQTGVVHWDAWNTPANEGDDFYFNTFLPGDPYPTILQTMTLTSWEGPTGGVTIGGGGTGNDFGDRMYGWFIPPVTTNYVFFISTDDGGRLSLSTDASASNLYVIACESDWNGQDEWTNISDEFPSSPHRGDGTASGTNAVANYVWDNSISAQSPATACLQNRSDQFIVAYYDSLGQTGLPGEPAGATDQANWATAESQVTFCIPPANTNFWPHVDTNGQAQILLVAGQKYFMQLEHIQNTGGYDEGVTYKFAGAPDPASPGAATILTGTNIEALVPFTPTISIAQSAGGPLISYTGVLLAGPTPGNITNIVATSSNGVSQYSPPHPISAAMFYRTSE